MPRSLERTTRICGASRSAIARLAAELGIDLGAELERYLAELRQIAAGVALVGEVSDRTRARVMSAGELMATELGVRFLRTQGLEVDWADARTMLKAEERRGGQCKASMLSATCDFTPDGDLRGPAGGAGARRAHAGLHRQRRRRQHRAARPRRLGYLGCVFRGETPRATPGDLDRRARHVQRQSALDPDGAPAARAALR